VDAETTSSPRRGEKNAITTPSIVRPNAISASNATLSPDTARPGNQTRLPLSGRNDAAALDVSTAKRDSVP